VVSFEPSFVCDTYLVHNHNYYIANCRRLHKGCDRSRPCSRCINSGVKCVEVVAAPRGRPPNSCKTSPRKQETKKKRRVEKVSDVSM
jgi:hypothetical protein